jgi:tRNA threonylcarbamoyl adenosine modification protein YeaZ/tRNA threonylcarbamoyl adenosine modification protein YjeE
VVENINEKKLTLSASELDQLVSFILSTKKNIIAVSGDLGSGKTYLAKEIIASLGIKQDVVSPTFSIVSNYFTKTGKIYHFDLYRLENKAGLDNLGFLEMISEINAISIIEWPEIAKTYLDCEDIVYVEIKYCTSPDKREYNISIKEGNKAIRTNELGFIEKNEPLPPQKIASKNILAIETTGENMSLAFLWGRDISEEDGRGMIITDPAIRTSQEKTNMRHLERLIPLISEFMADEKINKSDIDAIAVSIGPGSFTGIRIGVSTARALAQGLGKPIIAVPTMPAYAYQSLYARGAYASVAIDARRGLVYSAAYKLNRLDALVEVVPPAGREIEIFAKKLLGKATSNANRKFYNLYGSAANELNKKLWQSSENKMGAIMINHIGETNLTLSAASVALYARNYYYEKGYEDVMPDYMREAEAVQNLNKSTISQKVSEVK